MKDFETLGYVACVLEMNRRENNLIEYDEKNDDQLTTPTDYFNSKLVTQPHAGITSSSSARSGETSDLTLGIESSSQSPSKGSWSQFFLSFTGGTGLSSTLNQVPIGTSKTSSSSLTQVQNSASTTSSADRAVAKLKQQLGVSPVAYDSSSSKRRVEGSSSLPHEKSVSFITDGSQLEVGTKNTTGLRSQRRRVYRVIEYRHDELELSDTLDDPTLQTELECFRYYLCDLLLRREKIVERTMVVKMLRASDPNTQFDSSSRSQAQGLSGIDESCTIELFLRCGRCGGCLESLERICVVCDRIGKLPICSICHKKVPRLAQDCLQCFHGGHVECMRTWWKDEQMCPTGCGCFCRSSGGICGLMKSNEIDLSIGSDSTSVRTMKRRKSKSKRNGNGNKHLSRNTSYVTFS